MSDFVRVAQRVDDDAAAVLFAVKGLVGVPCKPVGKAVQVYIVDEIGVERRVGILRGDAGGMRREVGEHNGAWLVAEAFDKAQLCFVADDVVGGFNAPFARRLACGDVEKIGNIAACQRGVFAELFGGNAVAAEVAEQRAADKCPAAKFDDTVFGKQRSIGSDEFARQLVDVFALVVVVAEYE